MIERSLVYDPDHTCKPRQSLVLAMARVPVPQESTTLVTCYSNLIINGKIKTFTCTFIQYAKKLNTINAGKEPQLFHGTKPNINWTITIFFQP